MRAIDSLPVFLDVSFAGVVGLRVVFWMTFFIVFLGGMAMCDVRRRVLMRR